MMTHFYNPETDYILGPFDDRSRNWTPYLEGVDEVDTERTSRSFIPTASTGKDGDHWPESAVTVLSTLIYQVAHQVGFRGDIDELLIALIQSKKVVEKDLLGRDTIVIKRKLYELLKGTLASASVDPDASEHASSVISTITPKIRSMRFLRGLEDREKFSIRDWIKNKGDKGWLFIRVNEDQFDSVKPLVSAWIDTAIKSMLSTDKTETIELIGLVDELQSIDKINTLSKAVSEGRKFGLFMMLGFTSVNELFAVYGKDVATSMLSQCGTKLLFMTSSPEGQKWNAEVLGTEEVLQEDRNQSLGDRESQGFSERRDTQRLVVMPSEVASLPPLTAYVKFSGDWPGAKVKLEYKKWPVVATPTVLRKLPPPLMVSDESEAPRLAESPNQASSEKKPASVFGDAYRKDESMI
jgi:type IV secretory pathway TraG/TraD family ATPase VirD4